MPTLNDIYLCPKCNKNVKDNQNSLGCCICGKFHHSTCVKITKEQHSFLYRHKMFQYTCPICIANKASTNTPITPNVNINESTNPSSQTSDICDELRKCFVELSTSLEKQQNSYKMELEKQLQNGIQVFQKKVDDILNAVRAEYSNKINQLEEVKSGVDIVHMVDKSLNYKILELEKQNDVLQRRLNRANIVIQGLPKGIKDLRYPNARIAAICNVELWPIDIQHCCYIMGGNAVLVKFNSVYTRDCIMSNFSKSNPILLRDVIGGREASPVKLYDHLNESSSKIIYLSRKMWEEKKLKNLNL